MASHYTHVTRISTCPHSFFIQVRQWITASYSTYTAMPMWLSFHLSTPQLSYLSIPTIGAISFCYLTLCNNKSLRERRSGHSHKSYITSVIQSIIYKKHVTYEGVPPHHLAVCHARVLDLPLGYISKISQWSTTKTCHVQLGHALCW